MSRILGCLAIAVLSGAVSSAQQAVTAAGGDGAGSGGTVSYASGQTNYSSLNNSSGKVIEGVHQPFEIQVVTKLDPASEISLECEAFPNPAGDYLILKINREQIENMKYQLIDLKERILEEAFIGDSEITISMKHYRPTGYFLKVLDNSKEVMIFKITKTNQRL
jgi:hypothetical protein